MTDPYEGLVSFVQAYEHGIISVAKCTLHEDLYILHDDAEGTPRLTYASIVNGVVQGIAIYVQAEPVEGTPCFALGYAVLPEFRNQRIGTSLVEKSLSEIQHGFKKYIPTFFVEAVISQSNVHSNKIANKLLSSEPKSCRDSLSGEPAYQYLKLLA